MKQLFIILFGVALLAGIADAQTYVNYSLKNFVLNGGVYTASTNIIISSNTLVHAMSVLKTDNISDRYLTVQYPGGQTVYQEGSLIDTGSSFVGPCVVQIIATSSNNSNPEIDVTMQYTTVNTAPSSVGVLQVPNRTVAVTLQSSSNLTTWTTATNGNYGASDQYRFFRVSMQ